MMMVELAILISVTCESRLRRVFTSWGFQP